MMQQGKSEKICLLTNPFVSGANLTDGLREKNIRLIAVISGEGIINEEFKKRFNSSLFDQVYNLKDNFDVVINKLKTLNIIQVISDSDSGIYWADKISKELNLENRNDFDSVEFRINKFVTNERCRESGLSICKEIYKDNSTLSEEEENRLKSWNSNWVVKPNKGSAGGFSVTICKSIEEIKAALKNSFGLMPKLGCRTEQLVIQEKLLGDEYFIDTFSFKGKHLATCFCQYERKIINNSPICLSIDTLDLNSELAKKCFIYCKNVLNATQLSNGPAHIELMINNKNIRLIELNARFSGSYGLINQSAKLSYGLNQYNVLADLILDEKKFSFYLNKEKLFKQSAKIVMLQNQVLRYIKELNLKFLMSLNSYVTCFQFKKGEYNTEAKNVFDRVGLVLLAHNQSEVIKEDYKRIREMEENNLLY